MDSVTFVRFEVDSTTYLFTRPSETIEHDAIPILDGVRTSPAVLAPGESIGQRESVSIGFSDCHFRFDTEAFGAGTFWTKFRARYPSLRGVTAHVLHGERGQALDDMHSRMYVIDALQIGLADASLAAKDPLTLLDAKAAQAPAANTGELDAGIDDQDSEFTLAPAGVGNLEYPASGRLCLGGKEVAHFTRSGDTVTLTARGQNIGGLGIAHDAGTRVQTVLFFDSAPPSTIVNDLLSYTDVDASWITIADWQAEVDDYVDLSYSAEITEPTAVKKLLDELAEQVGLTLWWDAVGEQIRLKPLVPPTSGIVVDADRMMQGSFKLKEQPDKRVTQAWTFFGRRDSTEKIDEENNYAKLAVEVADNSGDFETASIRKIHSRWIDADGRAAAQRLNETLIARYKVPPRLISFSLFGAPAALPALGSAVSISHWHLVDADGVEVPTACQIISRAAYDDHSEYTAEEIGWSDDVDTNKYVYIDASAVNTNLRALYDSLYGAPNEDDVVNFVVASDVRLGGSYGTLGPSVDVGDWSDYSAIDFDLKLINNGIIQGLGGKGGGITQQDGHPGLTAFYTRESIEVVNNGSIIGGGGGGGSGDAALRVDMGGGGAGYLNAGPAPPGYNHGTTDAGGQPTNSGGAGGGQAQAGSNGSHGNGGAAGAAVDGDSFITWTATGTVTGSQIN